VSIRKFARASSKVLDAFFGTPEQEVWNWVRTLPRPHRPREAFRAVSGYPTCAAESAPNAARMRFSAPASPQGRAPGRGLACAPRAACRRPLRASSRGGRSTPERKSVPDCLFAHCHLAGLSRAGAGGPWRAVSARGAFSPTLLDVSSAGAPKGSRTSTRRIFGHFPLGEAKESDSPAGPRPSLPGKQNRQVKAVRQPARPTPPSHTASASSPGCAPG
jgi:hypothetical protein